jgi:hypothetical protein
MALPTEPDKFVLPVPALVSLTEFAIKPVATADFRTADPPAFPLDPDFGFTAESLPFFPVKSFCFNRSVDVQVQQLVATLES